MTVRDEQLLPWPRPEAELRDELRADYGAMTGLDREIGRLLETLKAKGELERTIVIFSSDHGLSMGSHGLLGKQNLYEHGMKAPLIFAGPGIPHGSSPALAYLFDIFPTVCGSTGVAIPQDSGRPRLSPIIAGKKEKVRNELFTAYRDVQRAVRDERWKLIRYPQIDKTQVFDLQNDPDELKDLADDPAHRGVRDRLLTSLGEWRTFYEDDAALDANPPKPSRFTPPVAKPAKNEKASKK
ncbi:MAG: sulfatase-like hydrolase/transferase [Pirellulales bacterium]